MTNIDTPESCSYFAAIQWVSSPRIHTGEAMTRERWTCHQIWHAGDGPLGPATTIRSFVGQRDLTADAAAEQFAGVVSDDGNPLEDGDVFKVAVQVDGNKYVAFGVRVRIKIEFEAREL